MTCEKCNSVERVPFWLWVAFLPLSAAPFLLMLKVVSPSHSVVLQALMAIGLILSFFLAVGSLTILTGLVAAVVRLFQGHTSKHAASTVRRVSTLPLFVIKELFTRN